MAQTDSPLAPSSAPRWWRVPAIQYVLGTVAILLWGAFFDRLTRVGQWIFDTQTGTNVPPLFDLHSRYRDAAIIVHHGHLYGFRRAAFTYPPITGYLFWPFHAIGWHATEIVWTMANLVVLAVVLAMVLVRWFHVTPSSAWLAAGAGLAPLAIFAQYPLRSVLFWGQLSLFLLFVVFVDLFAVPRRFRGLLIGAATAVKLLPAIFIVWFLAKREYPAVIRVAGAFVLLTLIAAALWPHASAQYWFHILPSGKDVLLVSNPANHPTSHGRWFFGVGRVNNQSLRGMLGRPPFHWPGTMPWLVLALAVVAVGVAVAVRCVRRHRELLAFVVLSLTMTLASPVSWVHYWVFALLAPFVAILEWRRDRAVAVASIVLSAVVCVNLEATILAGQRQFDLIGPVMLFVVRNLYVLGGLFFLGVVAVRVRRSRDDGHEPATHAATSRVEVALPAG